MHRDQVTVRTPKTLGCTVASTALIQSLRAAFPDGRLLVYTEYPDLFEGLLDADTIIDLSVGQELDAYDVDLKDYVQLRNPQTNEPKRHLIEHAFEIAEESLGVTLPRSYKPKVLLGSEEILWAERERDRLREGKLLIWLQTKTSTVEKDVIEEVWEEVNRLGSERYAFIDLSNASYSRRQALALTAVADGGITLDTFLLHGSQAVGARNVVVLLVSTYAEVVCYPDQVVVKHSPDQSPASLATTLIDKLNGFA